MSLKDEVRWFHRWDICEDSVSADRINDYAPFISVEALIAHVEELLQGITEGPSRTDWEEGYEQALLRMIEGLQSHIKRRI